MSLQNFYSQLPAIVSGYALDPPHQFGIHLAEATTNMVTNPSAEQGTTGYTLSNGATIARSSTRQRRGVYSLAITPSTNVNSGAYYSLTLTTGDTYSASLDFWGAAGVPYRIAIADNSGVIINRFTFYGKGRWVRCWVNAPITSTATYRVYFEKNGSASTAVFYVDGLQVEAKDYPTSYCDGDQPGLVGVIPAYLWTGIPHASTSTRHAQYRGGGRWVSLADLGFQLTSLIGLGMGPTESVVTPAGGQGGGYYQRNVDQSRVFSLVGRLDAGSAYRHASDRSALANALRMSTSYPRQPLTLTYQLVDEDGEPLGERCEIAATYDGPGVGATIDNNHAEAVELRFTGMKSPLIQEGWTGKALSYTSSVDDSQALIRLMQRLPSGVYAAVGAGIVNNTVTKIRYNPYNGLYYIIGSFTNGIKSYDPVTDTLSDLGSGLSGGNPSDLDFDTLGNVIVVGNFTTAGGAGATRIAKWTIATSAWSTFGTGFDAVVRAVCVFKRGPFINWMVAAGDFANANGVARARIAYITSGGTYTTMGTGLNNSGYALTPSLDGLYVYIGGAHTSAGGIANTAYFARWAMQASAFQATGSAGTIGATVRALCTHPSGDIYLGGLFTTATSDYDLVARYTGQSIVAVGPGLDPGGGTAGIVDMVCDPLTGDVYAAGDFSRIGPDALGIFPRIDLPSPMVRISGGGSVISFIDTRLNGNAQEATTLIIGPDRRLMMAESNTGGASTMLAAGTVTINRVGSADAYPVIELLGPGEVYMLRNTTTGKEICFDDLTLAATERCTLSLDPGNRFFTSSARGDMSAMIMPGSQDDSFLLVGRNESNNGENIIALYIDGTTTDGNTAATIRWREAYDSVAATVVL